MQTIEIKIEDSMYQSIVESGIDIQSKIKEFIYELIDDGYPTITTEEAKKRVSNAVEDYKKNGIKNFELMDDSFWTDTEKRLIQRNQKA